MTRICAAVWVAGAAAALFAAAAAGDEIRLTNGDRINGELKAMSAERLLMGTSYAGEIRVDWGEVASVQVSHPVEVWLSGRAEPLRATLLPGEGGRVKLVDTKGRSTVVALSEVRALNRRTEERGQGVEYSGRTLLSAAYSRGNADSHRLHADAELKARASDYRYALEARIDRRHAPPDGNGTAWLFGGNHDWLRHEGQFVYVRGSLEHDSAKDIDHRAAFGVGRGVQLFDSPGFSLSVRGGLDYVVVERALADGERYPALGWGIEATWVPWGPGLELFHADEGFWNLSDTQAVVLRSKSGLRVPLMSGLNATAQLNLDWESRPAPGRTATDSTLLLGLDYKF